MSDTDYIPSPSGWVRNQVEKIEATGDTRSVHIMNLPVVMLTMRGKKTGGIRKVPLMRVEHDGRLRRGGQQGRRARAPAVVRQPQGRPADHPAGRHRVVARRRPRDHRRRARRVVAALRRGLPALRRLPGQDRPAHPGAAARAGRAGRPAPRVGRLPRSAGGRWPRRALGRSGALGAPSAPRARPCGTRAGPAPAARAARSRSPGRSATTPSCPGRRRARGTTPRPRRARRRARRCTPTRRPAPTGRPGRGTRSRGCRPRRRAPRACRRAGRRS